MDLPGLTVSARAYDRGDGCTVVSLAGRAGIADTVWFSQLLELPQAQGPGRIIVDLSRLSSIDWWAALILLWACRVVSRRGGTLVLASPQPAVAQLLNTVMKQGHQADLGGDDEHQRAGTADLELHRG